MTNSSGRSPDYSELFQRLLASASTRPTASDEEIRRNLQADLPMTVRLPFGHLWSSSSSMLELYRGVQRYERREKRRRIARTLRHPLRVLRTRRR